MRLLICAGGTGGGVYPALAVLQAIKSESDMDSVLWVGGEGGMEADLVKRAGVPFATIPAAGVHGVGIRRLPGNIRQLLRGWTTSRKILHQFQPDVLFFTGGYVAVPMAVAGRKIPSLLFVPDIEPGLALKFLSRFASRIALAAEDSLRFLARKTSAVVTGYPTRPELSTWSRTEARHKLGLKEETPVLMVFGGSKGARSINRALLPILPHLLTRVQVVHISGTLDWEEVAAARATLDGELAQNYHPFPYLHEEMGAALACADLVVSRAGASTLGEFPLFGLPAILVPYPHAWRYQKVNADYLTRQGAALLLPDEQLKDQLLPILLGLFADPQKLEGMRREMLSLARPQAAVRLAELLRQLAPQKVSGDRP